MSAANAEEVRKQVRVYLMVFLALAALTAVTVGVSSLHLPVPATVAIALAIACVKGGLVAGYFMHLISEVKVIYWLLGITVIFFLALLTLPPLNHF
jgi:cytochrome c oxidase subunit 4